LRSLFSNDLIIELRGQKLVIRSFKDGLLYEDEPIIAIEKTNKGEVVKAIGVNAKSMASINTSVSNPFKHSRSFIGDFYLVPVLKRAFSECRRIFG
jgi:rod shape-determining protein MreB